MSGATSPLRRQPQHLSVIIKILVPVVIIAVIAGLVAWKAWPRPTPVSSSATAAAKAVSAQGLEERWGVKIYRLALTAQNGFVDFRLMVTDPDKALPMVKDEKTLPVLVVDRTGTELKSALPTDSSPEFIAGRAYGTLYPNARGELTQGDTVTIVIGDVKLERQTVE